MHNLLPDSSALHTARSTVSPCEAQDLHACLESMRGGSRSFFAAARVLPNRVRDPASALYAFCRMADDEVDRPDASADVMTHLNHRLDLIYAGQPAQHAADRALAIVVRAHHIPKALPQALLEGFWWDAQGRAYETLSDLHSYGARVAGAVGTMMALILGTRERWALARASELGLAMQLTNIARDVGEDARNGRLYLPRQWMREAGLDPVAWLQAPTHSPALAAVVQRLLREADRLYRQSADGVLALPHDCRPAIRAAARVYAEIGREVERAGLDSVSRRAVVGDGRKRRLMLRSLAAALPALQVPYRSLAPQPEIDFLVEACRPLWTDAKGQSESSAAGDRPLDQRVDWMFSMFERAAQRRQQGLSG